MKQFFRVFLYLVCLQFLFWQQACSPVVFSNAQVVLKIAPHSPEGFATQALNPDYCYGLNITGSLPGLQSDPFVGASCPGGTGGVGLSGGLYSVGEEVVLNVPSGGGVKFDLIAFPKNGTCAGAYNLVATAPGQFVGYVNGAQISTAPRLVATTIATVLPGLNEITLASVANEGANLVGQAYTCGRAPTISQVTQNTPNSFAIQGAHLGGVTQVQLVGPNTISLSVVSATANSMIATVGQSAQAFLGQAYNLVVSNAYGQSSTQVFLTLANDSVTPDHLDMTRTDWPFIPVKPIPASSMQIVNSFTPASTFSILPFTGSISDLFDSSNSTGVVAGFASTLGSYGFAYSHSLFQISPTQKSLKIFAKVSLENVSSNGQVTIRCQFEPGGTVSSSFPMLYSQSQLLIDAYSPGSNKLSTVLNMSSSGMYLNLGCEIEEESGSSNSVSFDVLISELRVFEEDPF